MFGPPICGGAIPRFFGVAVLTLSGRPGDMPLAGETTTPCISTSALLQSASLANLTKPYPFDTPVTGSVMILADLVEWNGAGPICAPGEKMP